MGNIQPVRDDLASLAQSMTDDVVRRIEARAAASAPPSAAPAGIAAETAPASARPDGDHPAVAAVANLARSLEARHAARVAERRASGTAAGAPPSLPAAAGPAAPATATVAATAAGSTAVAAPAGVVSTVAQCATLAAQVLIAKLTKSPDADQLEDELKFSTCDPAWATTIPEYLDYFGVDGQARAVPYVRYQSLDDFVLPTLPANAKVALVGDWGTGTAEALSLLEQVASHRPDVLVHLGDIYYSGTPDECGGYFLDLIDEVFDRSAGQLAVYTLAGNHDMYCGGVGYYGILPKLNPSPPFMAAQAQPASYFALRSADGAWQLLGMDTGLHDQNPFTVDQDVTFLDPAEETWHVDKIRRFSATGGRTILLSHHPLFSAFSAIGTYKSRPPDQQALNPSLFASYQRFQQAGDLAAWFWGHEHSLEIYQPFRGLDKGRCVGHGAIPTFLDSDPYKVLDGLGADRPQLVTDPANGGKPVQLADDGEVFAHGFVILELDDTDRSAIASYYQETSDQAMWVETL